MNASAKPEKVTTIEQAWALPEAVETRRRILQEAEPGVGKQGDTIIERIPLPFCPTPTDGDQILFFIDSDGRSMQVVYTPDGPAKRYFPWPA